ncbi:hypothetical protein J2T10_000111 [Paenarthrobacter nicotinovorans]|uniref:Uncharacterized protein n=1 Tax=Paenarthrobacter nicotinovorans TaxID=29320 RepID=A0ABT9TFV7_PAENI|nr:hypothetical protein [Paenarthrobacter nicotinovorans]MDQ0100492.1 hypothetical protein [Paenarthrobacter nicotinovorans]
MSKHYTYEWPTPRLRDQEVTAKPRIVVRSASFDVEYLGKVHGGKCTMPCLSLDDAMEYAFMVARRSPDEVRAINIRRDQARHIRRAAKLGLSVAA